MAKFFATNSDTRDDVIDIHTYRQALDWFRGFSKVDPTLTFEEVLEGFRDLSCKSSTTQSRKQLAGASHLPSSSTDVSTEK